MDLVFHRVKDRERSVATPVSTIVLDSPYRDILSDTILKLQDEGVIQKYYNKWWKEAANVKCEQEDKRKELASELGFANIGGVFVILAVGLVLSMIVAAVEFTIKIRQRKGREVRFFVLSVDLHSCFTIFRSPFEKKWFDTFASLCQISMRHVGVSQNRIWSILMNMIIFKENHLYIDKTSHSR